MIQFMRWEFLGSRKTAITILALIILAAAAGSFIPQGPRPGAMPAFSKDLPLNPVLSA